MNEKREVIAVMNSFTWNGIKKRTIEEARKLDDPMGYILQEEPKIVIDEYVPDGILQTWYRDVYEAMIKDDYDDYIEF